MTAEVATKLERRFVRDGLPWVVGAAALAIYLVTVNHWVTLSNLALVTRVSGWAWQPPLTQPLLLLLTYPLRWLPGAWVPLGLNVLTAVCASLTLATLARSVALLPHDRLEQQRLLAEDEHALLSVPNAWVPVVLAAVALGLQLTFWEHAIAASGEMLDLLLFAYIIRCLLEHRVDERQATLDRAAFLFGAAMANNWGMVAFLPLFVVALLRTKRLSFFSLRTIQRIERSGWEKVKPALKADLGFFLRMALLGLAGLSLLCVLPLLQGFSPDSSFSFWQGLQAVVAMYGEALRLLARLFLRHRRELALLLAAVSLLPVLLLSIRWGAFGGEESRGRFDLAVFISHISHAALLLICVWTTFDPSFSPRQLSRQTGLQLAFLPLYYLTALSVGYYSGFFLLVFGPAVLQRTSRRHVFQYSLCRTVPIVIYVLLGLAVVGLLAENFPVIRAANAPHLERYAKLAAASLPPEGALVLSDDPIRLTVLHAEWTRQGKAGRYVPVETRTLPFAPYRGWLSRKYPGRWPAPGSEADPVPVAPAATGTNAPLETSSLMRLVGRVAKSNPLYCLQPSVGFWFEQFYLRPDGLLPELKPYPPEFLSDPPLTSAELAENQAFWQRAIETAIRPVLQFASATELPRSKFAKQLMAKLRLQTPPPAQARVLALWYSGALNRWGVTLQRNGKWSEATPYFALAQELNPENLPARVNWQCNSNRLAGQEMTLNRPQALQEQLSNYRNLNQILSEGGPFDDPSYCCQLGVSFAAGGMPRQAAQYLDRAKALMPNNVAVRVTLGDLYNDCLLPDNTLGLVAEIRADRSLHPLGLTNEVEVALLEARAWFARTNRAMADGIIHALLAMHPGDAFVLDRAAATFTAGQSYSDALRLLDRLLGLTPNDPVTLAKKGNIYVLKGDYSNAIPPLTLSLSLTNTYVARLSRAMAYLRTGNLESAAADYQDLLQAFPSAFYAHYGLGEVAWQKCETNAAVRHYEEFLAKAMPESREAKAVAARLQALQKGRR